MKKIKKIGEKRLHTPPHGDRLKGKTSTKSDTIIHVNKKASNGSLSRNPGTKGPKPGVLKN